MSALSRRTMAHPPVPIPLLPVTRPSVALAHPQTLRTPLQLPPPLPPQSPLSLLTRKALAQPAQPPPHSLLARRTSRAKCLLWREISQACHRLRLSPTTSVLLLPPLSRLPRPLPHPDTLPERRRQRCVCAHATHILSRRDPSECLGTADTCVYLRVCSMHSEEDFRQARLNAAWTFPQLFLLAISASHYFLRRRSCKSAQSNTHPRILHQCLLPSLTLLISSFLCSQNNGVMEEHLLLPVFAHLTLSDLVHRVSTVCKAWNRIARAEFLWRWHFDRASCADECAHTCEEDAGSSELPVSVHVRLLSPSRRSLYYACLSCLPLFFDTVTLFILV